jgi:phage terminase large subunit-like protein
MTASTNSNYIRAYLKQIRAGRIIVSNKVLATYEHLEKKLDHPGYWHFDEQRAAHVIGFIERFCHPSKGLAARKPLKLMLWQKALISAVYGFVDAKGVRQFKEAYLIVGRKNGKSTLASGLSLYHLTKDGEAGPEVYSAATKKEQARIIWDESCKMIHKSPALAKRLKTLIGYIRSDANDGIFKPLSRDSNTMDGLNASAVFCDEIHAWKDMNLWDVLRDSMAARTQPLMFITTTAGIVRESVYDAKYLELKHLIDGYKGADLDDPNERTISFIYELDRTEELWDEKNWIKANPGLDVVKNRQDLREKVEAAKREPLRRKNLLTKDFNVPQNATVSYFDFTDLNKETFSMSELKPDYFIGGFDLSRTTDLTSACALFRVAGDKHIYVLSKSWMPEETFEAHKRDNVPYDLWIKRGLLELCPGKVIDDDAVVKWFISLVDKYDMYMYRVGFDRYSATHIIQEIGKTFGQGVLVPVAQGVKTLNIPMEQSKALIKQKIINYNNNPLLAWAMLNCEAKQDANGMIQPSKNRDLNKRIDPYAALLDALTVYLDNQEDYMARIE